MRRLFRLGKVVCNNLAEENARWRNVRSLVTSADFKDELQRSLYEPIFEAPATVPSYSRLNIQLCGYDFAVLEQFQGYVHKLTRYMGFKVVDAWASPTRTSSCTIYKPNSRAVEAVYDLTTYERNVQLADVPAHLMDLLLDVIQTDLPPGVQLSLHEHTAELENIRYIPNSELKETRKMLEEVEREIARQ
uniref:Ribosomal_S10 domain-containing protein n=1 Tax=Trichuris muris TaxID=70415 RepID=A0A5S6Q9E0_TRIMR